MKGTPVTDSSSEVFFSSNAYAITDKKESCEKKITFYNENHAHDEALMQRALQGRNITYYNCPHCDNFHFTTRR